MSASALRSVIKVVGAAIAWRIAAEIQEERRRVRQAAPVAVTRPDGTVDQIPAAPVVARTHPPLAGSRLRDAIADARWREDEDKDEDESSSAWRLPVVGALIGVAATFWALTHPLHVAAWPVAGVGLALAVVAWRRS